MERVLVHDAMPVQLAEPPDDGVGSVGGVDDLGNRRTNLGQIGAFVAE
jgi:hypothetical protein